MIQEQAVRELGTRREDPAYRSGWQDGRFGARRLFGSNPNLAGWDGHRDGRRVREMLADERIA